MKIYSMKQIYDFNGHQLRKLKKNFLYKWGLSNYLKIYNEIARKEIIIDSCIDIDDAVKEAHLYRGKMFNNLWCSYFNLKVDL